ncbi:fimbrial protein [Pseudomonas sp. BIGb0427]|uniref:fimbrial protein n=1 Tax=Pseudomonas sp. BIGb0427 TaxID=2724470 RepID=UPI00168EC009|nr:fimbrial protein [Pseudomonas sp. BIGb0427]NLU60340.1 fimbrial protein [Pseudomonas sp. BIGb0427]QPG61863.1 fimbrial protein [Pseudomonas sp. BIGb0427]
MSGIKTLLWLVAFSLPISAQAVQAFRLTITATILARPPCVINDNQPITAPFGEVDTTAIDGSYNTINLSYSLNCSRAVKSELRMRVEGVGATFDQTLLQVPSFNNLGIALKIAGQSYSLNTWHNFNANQPPSLQAVLVKRQDSEIGGGSFSSAATLVVDYQ